MITPRYGPRAIGTGTCVLASLEVLPRIRSMRLSDQDRRAILQATAEVAGPQARVLLFGSRTRDDLRGGDIDLLIEIPHAVPRPAWLAARLEAAMAAALGDQKLDILLAAPNLQELPVHRAARGQGVAL